MFKCPGVHQSFVDTVTLSVVEGAKRLKRSRRVSEIVNLRFLDFAAFATLGCFARRPVLKPALSLSKGLSKDDG